MLDLLLTCSGCHCSPYLQVLSCVVDRVFEELVDCSHLVLLHYQVTVLMFLPDEVAGLAVLLAVFGVDVW